jgi:hypothetical protein
LKSKQACEKKIAAFGSSYRGSHSNVGVAGGCDLLLLAFGDRRFPQKIGSHQPKAALA